jgi:hypothetical protein
VTQVIVMSEVTSVSAPRVPPPVAAKRHRFS